MNGASSPQSPLSTPGRVAAVGPYIQVPSAGSYSAPGDPVKPQSLTIASGAAHGRPRPGKWRDPPPGGERAGRRPPRRTVSPEALCLRGQPLAAVCPKRRVHEQHCGHSVLSPLSVVLMHQKVHRCPSGPRPTDARGVTGSAPSTVPARALLRTARTLWRPPPSQGQRALQGVGLPAGGGSVLRPAH